MPALTRLIMVQLTMGRLPPAYVFSSVQNAQILVFTTGPNVKTLSDDAALHTLHTGHYVDATDPAAMERAAAIPGYAAALETRASEPLPTWRTSNTSGTYGVLYHRTFELEYALQQRARAVEDAYLAPLATQAAPAGGPIPTSLLGLCAITVERCTVPSYVRFLTQAEVRAGVSWSVKAWEKEISTELRARVPAALVASNPEEAALSYALLQARAAAEQASMASREAAALEQLTQLFHPASASTETAAIKQFLHISAVVGHPGSPGAGSRALDQACELADANALPLVLEALPNRLLFAYYARWGFRPVVWQGTRPEVLRTFNPRVSILMFRAPVSGAATAHAEEAGGAGAGAGALAAQSPLDLTAFLAKLRFAESEDGRAATTELLRRPFTLPRTDIRPEALHLSTGTETAVYGLFVWHKVTGSAEVYVDGAYSWAREYARQVRTGEWGSAAALRIPLPDPVPELPVSAIMPTPSAAAASFAALSAACSGLPGSSGSSGSGSGSGGGGSSSNSSGTNRRRPATHISSSSTSGAAAASASPLPVPPDASVITVDDRGGDEPIADEPPAQRPRRAAPAGMEKAIQTSPVRPVAVHVGGSGASASFAAQSGLPPWGNIIFNIQAGAVVYFNYPAPPPPQPSTTLSPLRRSA